MKIPMRGAGDFVAGYLTLQQLAIDDCNITLHDLGQQLLQATIHRALLRVCIAVPVDDFVREAFTATADSITHHG